LEEKTGRDRKSCVLESLMAIHSRC
jgi:hypothetical protein